MDLGFDNLGILIQSCGSIFSLGQAEGNVTFRGRYLVCAEQLFCLIFVNFHSGLSLCPGVAHGFQGLSDFG